MAICPDCGSTVSADQDFCRNCGTEVGDVEGTEKAEIHLLEKETPIECKRVTYPSMGGNWIRAVMKDGTTRLYPMERIAYVEAGSKVADSFASPEPGNVQVKEVDTFDSLGQFLGSVSDALNGLK